jgi:hypothetical protein
LRRAVVIESAVAPSRRVARGRVPGRCVPGGRIPRQACSRRPCSSLAMFQVAQSGGQETRRGLRCRGRSSTYAFHHDVEGTRMTPTCHGEKSLGLRSLLLTVGSDVMANRSFHATSSRSFVAGEADRQAGNREWPADGRSGRREVPSRARACRAGRASPRALIARDLVGTNNDFAHLGSRNARGLAASVSRRSHAARSWNHRARAGDVRPRPSMNMLCDGTRCALNRADVRTWRQRVAPYDATAASCRSQ